MRWTLCIAVCGMLSCGTELPPGELEPEQEVEVQGPDVQWGRDWRRMDVDQLAASIERVTGGIQWTETDGRDEVNLFEALASTLGKPDYIEATHEELKPTLLFQKFLGDAANSVCTKLMKREVSSEPAERIFLVEVTPEDTYATNPEGVARNMSAALLRFHGREIGLDSPEMSQWIWLYESLAKAT